MKNDLIYNARTLIIARIVATIIPTLIDFSNLIMIRQAFSSGNIFHRTHFTYDFQPFNYKEKEKRINKSPSCGF